jgi:cell wall-associated NlpC family hydrolase
MPNRATHAPRSQYVRNQLGKKYSVGGALLSSNKILCQIVDGAHPATFFCSRLVFYAYKRAGTPITTLPPQCVTPGDAAVIAQTRLIYVGHLKASASWFPVISP